MKKSPERGVKEKQCSATIKGRKKAGKKKDKNL